jgi:replicative DNA helicase
MPREPVSSVPATGSERVPPYSEEAERGVLGSILLDSGRVMDLCVQAQIVPETFYVPAHRTIYDCMLGMAREGRVIDVLTVTERLQAAGELERIQGAGFLDRLIDSTPTAAHAEYYIDLVRQRHLLRLIIHCAQAAEQRCYGTEESADQILGQVEQAFLDITEHQHGLSRPWPDAVKDTMEHIEAVFDGRKTLDGVPTGFRDIDKICQGLRSQEMIVLAARPSMGKTSLAMNIAENVALGKGTGGEPVAVGVFSLEMSQEALVLRMLCSRAGVSSFKLMSGSVHGKQAHGNLVQAASVLSKAQVFLDDTGGLDVLELRARARRMKKKHNVGLILIDYLQLLRSKEFARQGKQVETADISSNLKSMAKELKLPVLVLSQLSRAPEQRDKSGKPKLSDLRDSGAIEQDADMVWLLRRPYKYNEEDADQALAIVEVAKQRNGPTGEVHLRFEESYTRFQDLLQTGVDEPGMEGVPVDELDDSLT